MNQEKPIDTIFITLVDSKSKSNKMTGAMYGLYKVDTQKVDGLLPRLRPALLSYRPPHITLLLF